MGNNINLLLGIANIGELLLQGKISRVNNGNPLNDIKLVIPNYQRPYKWTAKNAIQLLDDIIEAKNDNKEVYRVGTLILHYDKENNIYNVVDGQQRVTTFALLLLAFLEEKNIEFLNNQVTDNPFTRVNVANNYRAFVRRRDAMIDTQTKESSSMTKEEELHNDRNVKDLREYIEKQCELIVVITSDISEAFQFFDSQNARGKKLYPHDLLKAYHLREMNSISIEETEKIVKRWESVNHRLSPRTTASVSARRQLMVSMTAMAPRKVSEQISRFSGPWCASSVTSKRSEVIWLMRTPVRLRS